MLYRDFYVEPLISVLKRYSAPVTFKIKCDALVGETYDELSISTGVDGGFKEIKNVVSAFVELHLIPVYATDIKMKLTNIDLIHELDKTVSLSAESPYLITLKYDVDKGVNLESDSPELIDAIIEYLDIDVSGDGYISEKAFLEFENVDVTVYEIDDELKVVDLTKSVNFNGVTASEIKGGLNGECWKT